MRQPEVILTIAGSDSSGGAGIQADIKTISALGGYAASAITAITAQNTMGVQDVFPLPPSQLKAQLEAVFEDLAPRSVKIGMVYDAPSVRVIAGMLDRYRPPHVVYDPVMVSTSGRQLMADETIRCIKECLFSRCTLVTPNLPEASLLAGKAVDSTEGMGDFGRYFTRRYGTDVLVKGGHLKGGQAVDVLCRKDGGRTVYEKTRIESRNLHGTGCTLSSAVATFLAQGCNPEEAVEKAESYIAKAIEEAKDWRIGKGNGPLCHFPGH